MGMALVQVVLFAWGLGMARRRAASGEDDLILPLWARVLLSLSLVAAAFAIWRSDPALPYGEWVFWGMLMSFLGDLSMAGVIPWPQRLIGGMLTFAVAQSFYMTAFIQMMSASGGAAGGRGLWIGVAGYGLLLVVGWLFFIRNPRKQAILNYGALGYGLWVGGMACFALDLAMMLGGVWWLTAVGGLIFVLSDLLIGVTDVGGYRMKHKEIWIWFTYVAGQMAIIYAAAG